MSDLYVRKSVYSLTDEEETALRDAFTQLYQQPVAANQDLVNKFPNKYQELSAILDAFGHYQRTDLLFLPWARAYFWWFEQALRTVNPDVSLPYWDYTSQTAIEQGLPTLFTAETYVNANGATVENPLLKAKYLYPFDTYREVKPNTSLLADAARLVPGAMTKDNFVDFSMAIYPVDIFSHSYVGGSLANTHSTAYEPLFWFTHCQLDHFWWQWQQSHGSEAPKAVLNAQLSPFWREAGGEKQLLKGSDVMNTIELGYAYQD